MLQFYRAREVRLRRVDCSPGPIITIDVTQILWQKFPDARFTAAYRTLMRKSVGFELPQHQSCNYKSQKGFQLPRKTGIPGKDSALFNP
jgi:hypothetical protein